MEHFEDWGQNIMDIVKEQFTRESFTLDNMIDVNCKVTQNKVLKAITKREISKGYKAFVKNLAERTFHKLYKQGRLESMPLINELASAELPPILDWMFITVNMKEMNGNRKMEFKSLEAAVKKFCEKQEVSLYCFEQRSKVSGEYFGYHAHLLVKHKHRYPSKLREQLRTYFAHICDVHNKHCLNVQRTQKSLLNNRIRYINGVKKDSWKNASVIINAEWRGLMGIKDHYKTGFFDNRHEDAMVDMPQSDDWDDDESTLYNGAQELSRGEHPFGEALQEEEGLP